jgi:hypothetical protein
MSQPIPIGHVGTDVNIVVFTQYSDGCSSSITMYPIALIIIDFCGVHVNHVLYNCTGCCPEK